MGSSGFSFWQILFWVFNIPSEYRGQKSRWQHRSAFSKVGQLILTLILMILMLGVIFMTFRVLARIMTANELEEIVKAFLLIFALIILIAADVIFLPDMYKRIIMNMIVAFVCRPKKNGEPNKEETIQLTKNDEEVSNGVVDGSMTMTEIEGDKPKTSRAFDTAFAIINILYLVLFTAAIPFAIMAGLGS